MRHATVVLTVLLLAASSLPVTASAFGADGLALEAAVEIECWATVGDA